MANPVPSIAAFALIDQYVKQSGKKLYIVIEDVHSLVDSDRSFLTDLLANHSLNVYLLISRRTQEKNASLFSSPEVSYLMKENRVVEIHGLDSVSTKMLLKAFGITYELITVNRINELLKGNPYIF